MAYYVEHGGVYLKDTATLAGLGVVGRNNLFLSRELGPRVRLRAVGVEADLEPGQPLAWDPCEECPAPCRKACPQGALDQDAPWPQDAPGILPGRDGGYRREVCTRQMEADLAAGQEIAVPGRESPSKLVHYCRRCELACPAGAPRRSIKQAPLAKVPLPPARLTHGQTAAVPWSSHFPRAILWISAYPFRTLPPWKHHGR